MACTYTTSDTIAIYYRGHSYPSVKAMLLATYREAVAETGRPQTGCAELMCRHGLTGGEAADIAWEAEYGLPLPAGDTDSRWQATKHLYCGTSPREE